MSLVHEALQKAEREKLRKTGVVPPPQRISPAPAPSAGPAEPRSSTPVAAVTVAGTFTAAPPAVAATVETPAKRQSPFLTVLIASVAVVAIVAIVFLASLATSAIRDSRRVVGDGIVSAPPAPAPVAQTVSAQPAPPATAPAASDAAATPAQQPALPSPDPRYKISGITKDTDGKYWAIINGQLRSEDEYVDGAIVKSVERDRATLDVNGQTVVLRLF